MHGSYIATLYRIVADFGRDIMPLLGTAVLQMAVNLRVKMADSFSPFSLREIKTALPTFCSGCRNLESSFC